MGTMSKCNLHIFNASLRIFSHICYTSSTPLLNIFYTSLDTRLYHTYINTLSHEIHHEIRGTDTSELLSGHTWTEVCVG